MQLERVSDVVRCTVPWIKPADLLAPGSFALSFLLCLSCPLFDLRGVLALHCSVSVEELSQMPVVVRVAILRGAEMIFCFREALEFLERLGELEVT